MARRRRGRQRSIRRHRNSQSRPWNQYSVQEHPSERDLTGNIATVVTDDQKRLGRSAREEPNHYYETMSLSQNKAKPIENGDSKGSSSSNMQHHPSPSPSNRSRRETDIKHLIELLCDRMYWYMQRDKQDKNLKKMQAEFDRTRPGYPESSNHSEVLRLQIDQWMREKRKSCDRLSGTDGKLLSHLIAFIDRQHGKLLSTHSHHAVMRSDDVDARLNDLEKTLDDKFRACLKEVSTQIINDSQLQLQKETQGLRIGLEQEREKSARLQKHMEEMEQRLGILDKRQLSLGEETRQDKRARLQLDGRVDELESKLNRLSNKVDDLATNTITSKALSRELGRFDTVVSTSEDSTPSDDWDLNTTAGVKTRRRLNAVADEMHIMKQSLQCESVDGAPQSIIGLHKRLDSCMERIHVNSEEQMSVSEAVKAIQDALKQTLLAQTNDSGPRAPSKPARKHKTEIEEVVYQKFQPLSASLDENLKAMMQEKLTKVAQDLGSFVDRERIARESATAKAEQALADVSDLRRDVDVWKDGASTSVDRLDQKIGQQSKLVASWNESLACLDGGLQRVSREAEANLQKLELQIQTVDAWQRNFTTKDLYRDITRHITSTLPQSTLQKITSLTSRLETIEAHLSKAHGDGTPRKRKTPHN